MGVTVSAEAYRLVALKQALKIHVMTQGRIEAHSDGDSYSHVGDGVGVHWEAVSSG